MKDRISVVVGIRRLRVVGLNGEEIIVKIGKPRREKGGNWACPFHLSGLGFRQIEYGHGIDAIQSLLMAIDGIRVRLEQSGKLLVWAGGESGDTGFTRFIPAFYGVNFSKRLNRLIEREIKQFARTAEKRHGERRKVSGPPPKRSGRTSPAIHRKGDKKGKGEGKGVRPGV